MTTAQILEAMTDRALFERLATSVLRKNDPNYQAIIHTGINAKGETAVDSLDGIHLVPNSNPAHYVYVQHTTTEPRDLRGKWLTRKDSDLTKAIEKASSVRGKLDNTVFTVVLCTNQRIDGELVEDVTVAATEQKVGIDIWEQTRIVDFLDNDSDGHWLRKIYLGIEAERLSVDLLHRICQMSIDAYRRDILVPRPNKLIHRQGVHEALHEVIAGESTVGLLVGYSGFGKSVSLMQAMEERLACGQLALWLPARCLERNHRLSSALDDWLRELHPQLEVDSGRIALSLVTPAHRLAIAIDDINRTGNPIPLLRTAVGEAAPRSRTFVSGTDAHSDNVGCVSPSHVLLIPVWPAHLSHFRESLKEAWLRLISIGQLIPSQSSEIIRSSGSKLTEAEAAEFGGRLGHDPIAVAAFADLVMGDTPREQMAVICEDALGRFIEDALQRIARDANQGSLLSELKEAVRELGSQMLVHRDLQPLWSDVCDWFEYKSRHLTALRQIVQDGHFFRLTSEDDRVVFRHDRFRERTLVDGMTMFLRSEEVSEDVACDPYFSDILGRAIANVGEAISERLERLREIAPLGLVSALRFIRHPESPLAGSITNEAKDWLENAVDDSGIPPTMLIEATKLIEGSDSPLIADVTDGIRDNVPYIRLAHGDLQPVLHHWERVGQFFPVGHDAYFEAILHRAVTNHGDRLIGEIAAMVDVPKLDKSQREGVLAIAGYIGDIRLADAVGRAWHSCEEKSDLLVHALWAAIRCSGDGQFTC